MIDAFQPCHLRHDIYFSAAAMHDDAADSRRHAIEAIFSPISYRFHFRVFAYFLRHADARGLLYAAD